MLDRTLVTRLAMVCCAKACCGGGRKLCLACPECALLPYDLVDMAFVRQLQQHRQVGMFCHVALVSGVCSGVLSRGVDSFQLVGCSARGSSID